jgi:hypothetical protein
MTRPPERDRESAGPAGTIIEADHPGLAGRTGRGVRVAVIDSGVNPWHPHVRRVTGGVGIGLDATVHDDHIDRLGHGTAVAAAIRERAPDAEILSVRVFEDRLATTVKALVAAIDWSIEQGARLVNLSLGTPNEAQEWRLAEAIDRAREHGMLVVSAAAHEGTRWLPGALPDAMGVLLAWDLERHQMRIQAGPPVRLQASGYPRPIPGVPPEMNLKGISFAVANATGFLACLLEKRPGLRVTTDVRAALF